MLTPTVFSPMLSHRREKVRHEIPELVFLLCSIFSPFVLDGKFDAREPKVSDVFRLATALVREMVTEQRTGWLLFELLDVL